MTINSNLDLAQRHLMKIGFYATLVIFNLCLITQLLTVGVAFFINPTGWSIHVWLVRGYGGLSLVLLGWAFITPFSPQIQRLTASLAVLMGLQFVSIHLKSPLHLEILHPLLGFSLLYVSLTLVHQVWRSLSPNHLQNEQI